MEQFLAVNLVSILQLITFIGGGIWVVSSMKSVQLTQSNRLESIEKELYELRKIVVALARQEERMTAMDQRMLAQGSRLDRITNQLYKHGSQEEKD